MIMKEQQLDCRGLACPTPVLKTKELIEQKTVDQLTVLVDNPAAKENVGRFLSAKGYLVHTEEREGGFSITGVKAEESSYEGPQAEAQLSEEKKILVLVATGQLGRGDEELGRKLMVNFIGTLKEMGPDLWRLVLVNGGVKFAVEGSEVLEQLQALEKDGTTILVCGTCLTHFNILEKKRVGETTNMLDIVTSLQVADKIINLS
jgi:selenium metabolism protein YedF